MKIVIKVGTQSILSEEGEAALPVLAGLVEQIVALKKQGHEVVFVSSGAVGMGIHLARQHLAKSLGSSIGEKQVLASFGQPKLMHMYGEMFLLHGILVSQILLTKQDFYTRRHYLNIARMLQEIFKHTEIVPIINENDSVAIEELMFTDNDELAGLIAAQITADKLIILSNIEGVYATYPSEPDAPVIPVINPFEDWPALSSHKSLGGRGGMLTKLTNAKKMSQLGITTHIACAHRPDVIVDIVAGKQVGTTILASKKKSSIKKWVAYGVPNGKVYVNAPLYDLLKQGSRALSLLPVGIERFTGTFAKGDVVQILSPKGEAIGFGVAGYDFKKLQEVIGQKNKAPFVHYDYLYIF